MRMALPRLLRMVGLVAVTSNAFAMSGTVRAASAPEAWALWDEQAPSNGAVVDHSSWQQFLEQYVVVYPDGVNRLAYKSVTPADRQLLNDYIGMLSTIDPRAYRKAEQLPYWINLYNAATVRVVLGRPMKGSILRMGRGYFSSGPWDDEVVTVAGQPMTLNDIEHRVLRPIFRDYRIHYAVNCASFSCPNLVRQAYTRANAEQLLADNEIRYINHDRGMHIDSRGRLVLSRLYEWYAEDFAADTPGLLAYLSSRHTSFGLELKNYTDRVKYSYDWSLNGVQD